MPAVYTFSRSDNEILQDLLRVFTSGRGTAQEQWSMQVEVLVEPVGWDALWKLSKAFCKKFEVRYPCVAYITVTSVDFETLSANVDVLSVQHEAVRLPETVEEVPLVELWPTKKQREQCIDAGPTAEFIDLLRFYYENIWMPWDDQYDKVLLPNTIEDRMQLWSELHNGTIPNYIARSINLLRISAINAHDKLKELDTHCEGDLTDEDDSLLPPNYISNCAEMNARLDSLMSQWTLYENTLIREQLLAKMKLKWQKNKSKKNVVALWRGGSVFEFDELAKYLRARVSSEQTLAVLACAEEALALQPDEVYVCSAECELPELPLSHISLCGFKAGATLRAAEMRSCLLMAGEECRVSQLTLHCAAVNTVVVARAGRLRLAGCALLDDSACSQSDFAQGLVAMAGAKVLIEDCTFDNFYSGIVVHKGAQVELRNCVIRRCGVGIQMYRGSRVRLDATRVAGCGEHSVRCEGHDAARACDVEGLEIMPNCNIGSGDLQKEVLIVKQDVDF